MKEILNLAMLSKFFFEISNGHNWGAIWSNRDETLSCDTAMTSSCSGEGSQGAWGLGRWEKVEKCLIFGPLFFALFGKIGQNPPGSLKLDAGSQEIQYEPNPSEFDRFRQTFSFLPKSSKKSGPKMKHFSTFS